MNRADPLSESHFRCVKFWTPSPDPLCGGRGYIPGVKIFDFSKLVKIDVESSETRSPFDRRSLRPFLAELWLFENVSLQAQK